MNKIYLDSVAHHPVCEEVKKFLRTFDYDRLANPSSTHENGIYCRQLIEDTRCKIAELLRCDTNELIFTSGASEGASLALNVYYSDTNKVNEMSGSSYEHNCIAAHHLYRNDDHTPEIQMLVNNETGQIFDIDNVYLCDITSAVGNIDINLHDLDTSTAISSSEKFGSLSGSGFLYISSKNAPMIKPLIYGTQERGLRGGTENTIGIVCMGIALEQAMKDMNNRNCYYQLYQSTIKKILSDYKIDYIVNGGDNNIPSIMNISFKNIDGTAIVSWLDANGIALSTGSACHSGSNQPSPVLKSMGVPDEYINGTVRFSFNEYNTIEEIKTVANKINDFIKMIGD